MYGNIKASNAILVEMDAEAGGFRTLLVGDPKELINDSMAELHSEITKIYEKLSVGAVVSNMIMRWMILEYLSPTILDIRIPALLAKQMQYRTLPWQSVSWPTKFSENSLQSSHERVFQTAFRAVGDFPQRITYQQPENRIGTEKWTQMRHVCNRVFEWITNDGRLIDRTGVLRSPITSSKI
ncbi:predicted protein [Histoplasma capsulatum G186AR]|uniref:Uncharacterized protein n=1 Tax=Ajellomyces capsulatus (strain G186AR / H82 / ATCC MYA-2454 / RMSCC 2432) TaxID=447093 RepID=C0NVA5_AJECG|nr:uncharacterized protein HCBG_07085 [Histoplasma capsulatum G186AR]EEH04444.1 predicted protein [Histoplasma capsulatum G186AR]